MPTIDYLNSRAGQVGRHLTRRRTRLRFVVDGIEPRSKNAMADEDKRNFRQMLLGQLRTLKRRPFRKAIALQIVAHTSDKAPAHAQTIAKNLLDLLGRHSVRASRDVPVLYTDDSQVDTLSVICSHGHPKPLIVLEAMPLGDFLSDLSLAAHASTDLKEDDEQRERDMRDDSVRELRDLLEDADSTKKLCGAAGFEAWLSMRRRSAQESLLGQGVTLWDLAQMYGVYGAHQILPGTSSRTSAFRHKLRESWESIFHLSPLRIRLAELPTKPGSSAPYRDSIDAGIEDVRKRFGWIMDPLLIPVSLEVVVKPPRVKSAGPNDLDNVLRNYLIPRFLEALKPPSDIRWTFDLEAIRRERSPGMEATLTKLPKSTRVGITRYEAWRLPRASSDKSPGYVTVSLLADPYRSNCLFRRIDQTIEKWADSTDSY